MAFHFGIFNKRSKKSTDKGSTFSLRDLISIGIKTKYQQIKEDIKFWKERRKKNEADVNYKKEFKAFKRQKEKELKELEKIEEAQVKEVDLIIDNFKHMVDMMTEDDYTAKYHMFRNPEEGRTANGTNAKKNNAEDIKGVLDNAISQVGIDSVAQNIKVHGFYIESLVEGLIFALYDSKYAKWGGGISAYNYSLEIELFGLLTGGI